jgi:hypothetical protein
MSAQGRKNLAANEAMVAIMNSAACREAALWVITRFAQVGGLTV